VALDRPGGEDAGHRSRKLGVLLVPMIMLAACTAAEPEPPAPVVTTQEFEQRLDEHLTRFASQVLEPDVQVSAPAHSRTAGCARGPSWGVVPRSETTVTAGDQAEKLLDDLQTWMLDNGFDGLFDADDNEWRAKRGGVFRELTGTSADGTQVIVRLPRDSPQFTITVTGPCTWPPDRDGGPSPSGRLAPLPAPSAPRSTVGSHYRDPKPCLSPKLYVFNGSAPAFTGPGPHPMVLADYTGTKEFDDPTFLYSEPYLPFGWEPDDQHQAQLLVCVHVTTTRAVWRKITCNYTNMPDLGSAPYEFDLLESIYRVTVREARSGRVVSETSIPGTVGDETSCPNRMDNYLRPLALRLDGKMLEQYLRPLYESAR
jgi:hypothetical protein